MPQASINSADRQSFSSTTSDNYNLVLPYTYSFSEVVLKHVNLGNTIYKIITGINDTLDWNDGTVRSITLPAAAYSITSLCSTIQTMMTAVNSTWTVTYNTDTMKVTFNNTALTTFSLLFGSGANASKSIAMVLGFTPVDTAYGLSVVGPNVIALYAPFLLYIRINQFPCGNFTSKGVLYTFAFPVNVNSQNIVEFDELAYWEQRVCMRSLITPNVLNISLVTDNGLPVNLNGGDWTMILEFK